MIRRRIVNLKIGDILYHKLDKYGHKLVCGKITNITKSTGFRRTGYNIRYQVFRNIDTTQPVGEYRTRYFGRTATIVEEAELDLLMLGQ
jgi:hypothetical protein